MRAPIIVGLAILCMTFMASRDVAAIEWSVRYLASDVPEQRRYFVCEKDVVCDRSLLPRKREPIGMGTTTDGHVLIGPFLCRTCDVRTVRVVCKGTVCFGGSHQAWGVLMLLLLFIAASIGAVTWSRSDRRDEAAKRRYDEGLGEALSRYGQ